MILTAVVFIVLCVTVWCVRDLAADFLWLWFADGEPDDEEEAR